MKVPFLCTLSQHLLLFLFVCEIVVFLTRVRGYHIVVLIDISLMVRQN